MSLVAKINGQLVDQAGSGVFDSTFSGSYWDISSAKGAVYIVDARTSLSSALTALAGASWGELYVLSSAGGESGHSVLATVPSSVAAGIGKSALIGRITTGSISNFGGSAFSTAYGVNGVSVTSAGNTQGTLVGTGGQAYVDLTSDAQASAGQFILTNAGGTAVTTVGTALSKVVVSLVSQGAAKNSAFLYAAKTGTTGVTAPVNCTNGIVVDGASVDVTAFCVASGSAPTVLWGRDPAGKRLVAVTSGSGAGPIAAAAASHITVTTVSQTAAAGATGTPVVVNTTAVTANSRIIAQIISYSGTLTTNGLPVVYITALSAATSFTFAISNAHSANALSGTVTVAFTIEN
jgi:hypothetical protein